MKIRNAILVLLSSFIYFGCRTIGYDAAVSQNRPFISIVRLLADPDRYNGKRVLVTGYLRIEYEGNVLYLHDTDFKNRLRINGLWVNIPDDVLKRRQEFSDKYVIIEGIFDATDKGFSGTCSGSIKSVTGIKTKGDGFSSTYPDSSITTEDPFGGL